jgi:hypothetical protein
MWSVFSLFLVFMWWPVSLGRQDTGLIIAAVGIGIFLLTGLGGWTYKTWQSPREGFRIAALMAIAIGAQWLEDRYGINWRLTATSAAGALLLVMVIVERRRRARARALWGGRSPQPFEFSELTEPGDSHC